MLSEKREVDSVEIWKPAGVHPNYEVSSAGQVRNVKTGRVLKPMEWSGYTQVELGHKSYKIHRLVTAAFIGPCPDDKWVNHLNGIRNDNRIENLEYVTPSGNTLHAYRTGLKKPIQGDNHWKMKIPDSEIDAILDMHKWGASIRSLARFYNVSKTAIQNIVHGRRRTADGRVYLTSEHDDT